MYQILTYVLAIIGMGAICNPPEEKRPTFDLNDPVFEIPFIDSLIVDGEVEDWDKNGQKIRLFAEYSGRHANPTDFSPSFRMAWNRQGLFLLVEVKDDVIYESPSEKSIWNGDGLEIFLCPEIGLGNTLQFAVSPGLSKNCNQVRSNFYDYRTKHQLRKQEPKIFKASKKTKTGYLIELNIPLSNIGVVSKKGEMFGLQLYTADYDIHKDKNKFNYIWHPQNKTFLNPFAFHEIKLASANSETIDASVKCYLKDGQSAFYTVLANQAFVGKEFSLQNTDRIIYSGKLNKKGNLAKASFSLKLDPNQEKDPLALYLDGKVVGVVDYTLAPIKHINTKAKPFESEVRVHKARDQRLNIPNNPVLFIGSSSIRQWKTLEDDFPGLNVINRGFGGSQAKHVLQYINEIVLPYKPTKIVYYEGDNDITRGVKPSLVLANIQKFVQQVHNELPNTKVYILSVKPSPARKKMWPKMQETNRLIVQFCNKNINVFYVDVATGMLNKDGSIRTDIFLSDMVHMTDEGYAIWTEIISEAIQ